MYKKHISNIIFQIINLYYVPGKVIRKKMTIVFQKNNQI